MIIAIIDEDFWVVCLLFTVAFHWVRELKTYVDEIYISLPPT